jgi:dTDP-4-amino-4,6-dideoxy-D-galactose acyltransferase
MCLTQLWEDGTRLAYWGSDPRDVGSQTAATANQGLLVDKKTVFVRELHGFVPCTPGRYETHSLPEDGWSDVLARLALQIGQYSRFRQDYHFSPETWLRLYYAWMQNSINRTIADEVLVIRDSGLIVALVTVRARESIGEIGLLGVDESHRGVGLGRALVDAAMRWFLDRRLSSVRVVTQGGNLPACKLYEACGFVVDSVENFYHFWNPRNDPI